MENSKQTQIPLASSLLNKKWFAVLLTIGAGVLIFGFFNLITSDYHGQSMPTRDNFSQQIAEWQKEFDQTEETRKQAEIDKCESIKIGAILKLQANSADSKRYPLTPAQWTDLDEKRSKDCEPQTIIPTAKALSFEGSENLKPLVSQNFKKDTLDLDKLAIAVSYAETSGCKDGTAIKRNNCHGIMQWNNGKRSPRYFASKQESFDEFKRIWAKSYKRFPDLALAAKWTGNDRAYSWLATVKKYYYQ